MLKEELCGITASRVVFNCLHEILLGLAVFSGDLVGTGEELVHISMNVGKGSKILSRKFEYCRVRPATPNIAPTALPSALEV